MPFEPLVLGKLCSSQVSNSSRSSSATSAHSTIVAGGPGSRSNASVVGFSMSCFFESEVCSSRSARLASQTSVGRSLQSTKSIVRPRAGTGTVFTQSGRCEGACFS